MISSTRRIVRKAIGQAAWRGARCCFVPCTGRTGSHTLTSLLNLSPDVRAFHHPAPQLLAESLDAFEHAHEDPRRFEQIFTQAKSAEIGVARIKGQIYAETSNRLTFFAPVIALLLPKSKFIFVHRHPADVVRSGMRRGWYRNHPWDAHRISPRPHDAAYSTWSQWDSFAKCCWYWRAMNEFALDFQQTLSPERGLTLRFDDFMDVESRTWRTVFEFLEVAAPAEDDVHEVFARRENGQREGVFPPVCEWDDHQRKTLVEIAGEVMEKLDYSLDSAVQFA